MSLLKIMAKRRSRLLRKLVHWESLLPILLLVDTLQHFVLHMRSSLPASPDTPIYIANQTIFIASTHWNTEKILRNNWNSQIIQLTEYLEPSNVFVSIYENGSWDNSKGALGELSEALQTLGVRHKIVLDPSTHSNEISRFNNLTGWVYTPQGH